MRIVSETTHQKNLFYWDLSQNQPIPTTMQKTMSEDVQSCLFNNFDVSQQKYQSQEISRIEQEKSHEAVQIVGIYQIRLNSDLKNKNHKKKDEKLYPSNQIHKIISRSSKGYDKKKPDYKKNICGYITKKIVKEAVSNQYTDVLLKLCQKFSVEIRYFQKTFKCFENITGPTHLYNLVNPRLKGLSCQDQINEIKAKRVFRIFFIWFLRYRYIRYIIVEGKMQKKDVYIRYKNKELLHLISQEGELSQNSVEDHVKMFDQLFVKQTAVAYGQESRVFNDLAFQEVVQQNLIEWQSPKLQKRQIQKIILQNPQNYPIDETQWVCKDKQTLDSKTLSFEELVFGYLN